MRKKIAVTFMVTGLLLLFASASILVFNTLENKNAEENADLLVHSIIDIVNQVQPEEMDPFDTEMKTETIDGNEYIGYLEIPDLNLYLPVMADWDYEKLKISPCRYYGSTKTDNLVIAAHNYKSHFGYLGNLRIDEIIAFTDMEGQKTVYRVNSVELLQPTDVEKVKDTGDDLILYTCTYGGAQRITVRCAQTQK